jgi:hypothetical protein
VHAQAGEDSLQKRGSKRRVGEDASVSNELLLKCNAACRLRFGVGFALTHQRQNFRDVAGGSRDIKPPHQLLVVVRSGGRHGRGVRGVRRSAAGVCSDACRTQVAAARRRERRPRAARQRQRAACY